MSNWECIRGLVFLYLLVAGAAYCPSVARDSIINKEVMECPGVRVANHCTIFGERTAFIFRPPTEVEKTERAVEIDMRIASWDWWMPLFSFIMFISIAALLNGLYGRYPTSELKYGCCILLFVFWVFLQFIGRMNARDEASRLQNTSGTMCPDGTNYVDIGHLHYCVGTKGEVTDQIPRPLSPNEKAVIDSLLVRNEERRDSWISAVNALGVFCTGVIIAFT